MMLPVTIHIHILFVLPQYCPVLAQDTAIMGKHLQWVWPDWLVVYDSIEDNHAE